MNKTIIFFDIESTGTNVSKDRIVSICFIKTDINFEILEKKYFILNPEIQIPIGASEIHGIYDKDVVTCPKFSQYATKFLEYLNDSDYLAGFNSKQFDTPLLYEEFSRCKLEWNPKPQIDCSVIFKNREPRTLSAALQFYCGMEFDGAHNAENDVIATINVLSGQIFRYGLDCHLDIENDSDLILGWKEVDKVLIEESKYPNEDRRLDFRGNIILDDNDVPIWDFGKNKGQPVKNDMNYCNWVLTGVNEISSNTKNVLKAILNNK